MIESSMRLGKMFDEAWSKYPKRVGKKQALKHFKASVKTPDDFNRLLTAIDHYTKSQRVYNGYIKDGSAFFNNWEDWVEYEEPVCKYCKGTGKYITPTGYEMKCDCKK